MRSGCRGGGRGMRSECRGGGRGMRSGCRGGGRGMRSGCRGGGRGMRSGCRETCTIIVRTVNERVSNGEMSGRILKLISPTKPEVMLPHSSASHDPGLLLNNLLTTQTITTTRLSFSRVTETSIHHRLTCGCSQHVRYTI